MQHKSEHKEIRTSVYIYIWVLYSPKTGRHDKDVADGGGDRKTHQKDSDGRVLQLRNTLHTPPVRMTQTVVKFVGV